MTENASYSNVCSVFDTHPYVTVAVVSSGSAMVSALCCIFVICLIFLLKKHYFFIQRIILYHCLAALFHSLSIILYLHRLGYEIESTAQVTICIISGFTTQLTSWIIIMDYSVITFTLLMTAVFHKNAARLERLYVVLIFIFPLIFNWIPFIENSYGRSGAWCWIRSVNYDDCTEHQYGQIFRIILWYVPFFSLFLTISTIYSFTIAYVAKQRYCKSEKNIYDPDMEILKKHLNKEVWPLLFFPFGVLFLNFFLLINSIYLVVDADPVYAMWMLQAIFGPFQGGYIALVYVLDRDTLKRLTCSNIKAIITRQDNIVHEYLMEDDEISLLKSAAHDPPTNDYGKYEDNNRLSS